MTEQEARVLPSNGVERLDPEAGAPARHALARFPMTTASQEDSTGFADDIGDDTIELALTEEDMLALSRAADEERVETNPGSSSVIATAAFLRDRSLWSRRWIPVLASSILGVVICIVLGVVAHRISVVTITAPSEAERSPESLDPPVRFSNPFDASEVFEFPPGTSDEQARQSAAAILLQRARDRRVTEGVKSSRPMPGAGADRVRLARNSEPHGT